MQELLLAVNIAAYLGLGYLLMIGLLWLVTLDAPELWIYRDWALKPLVFILSPFGIKFAPQDRRPEVREALERNEAEEHSPAAGERNQFRSIRAAKEYLVGRIAGEARREGVPLTEIEEKMLYFSETGWTPPGIMNVNAEFERDYDQDAYEQKIAGLVHALEDRASKEEQDAWDDAILKLSDSDHYLLVLIGAGEKLSEYQSPALQALKRWLPTLGPNAKRDRLDVLRLIVVALAIFASIIVFASLTGRR